MPSISNATSDDHYEPFQSFSIINGDNIISSGGLRPSGQLVKPFDKENDAYKIHKNVNVVKPVLRIHERSKALEDLASAGGIRVEETGARRNPTQPAADDSTRGRKRHRKTMETLAQSHTILDPRFSRNLDLKLRRLKEKEIIAERLSRRSKERAKVVSSNIPKVNIQSIPANVRKISVSNPNVTLIKPNVVNLKMDDVKKESPIEVKQVRKNYAVPDGKTPDNLDIPGRSRRTTRSNESIAVTSRPLFVTTVRKGQFLPPPPEMATLLGLEGYVVETPALYSYSSRPKVLGNTAAPKPVIPISPTAPEKEPESMQTDTENKEFSTAARSLAILTGLAAGAAGLPSGAAQNNMLYGNLMTDRRVFRGSTTAANLLPARLGLGDVDGSQAARAAEARRRAVARRRVPRAAPAALTSLPAAAVQTEPYLEELYDKGVEMEIGVQTDLMLERPVTPVFVPAKTGCDVGTQILPGDLFNFDEEVIPILDVLVNRTIEQALVECTEEESLHALRRRAAAAAEIKATAAASARHHQRHQYRLNQHKENRIAEEEAGLEDAAEAGERAAAAALVRAHLPPLLPGVLDTLRNQGYLRDEPANGMDETFIPWLMSEVTQEVESMITSRDVLTDIVREVLETRAELYRAMGEDEDDGSNNTSSRTETTVSSGERSAKPAVADVDEEIGDVEMLGG